MRIMSFPQPFRIAVIAIIVLHAASAAAGQDKDSLNSQLFQAAGLGQLGAVTSLLKQGANPNFIDPSSQRTVLQSAVIGDLDVVRTGAHLQVVELLLDRGARFEEQPGGLGTALFDAVGVNGVDPQTDEEVAIVELLLNRGASVAALSDVTSSHGPTPLHAAAYHVHLESARLLIAHRADVNAIDPSGATPLQVVIGAPLVACKDKAPLIKLLKQHGAKGDGVCKDEP